ncbi:hypothetical protein ANN_12698 [Periplaneta americana]|uniref:Uncharacterized protein n=1 Tax=Periplaneta americana TaxID=6978 RepID=A0ABQ8TJV0_PERAM|nr:hypothetical protein ANN_12698 [Periplaneta americana]
MQVRSHYNGSTPVGKAGTAEGTDELKANITREIRKITEDELIRVNNNFIKRCQKCVDSDYITSNIAYNKVTIDYLLKTSARTWHRIQLCYENKDLHTDALDR